MSEGIRRWRGLLAAAQQVLAAWLRQRRRPPPRLPDNVIDFEPRHPDQAFRDLDRVLGEPPDSGSVRLRQAVGAIGCLVIGLLAAAATALLHTLRPAADYATGVGERRTISLGDGSMALMNTRTRLRVRYTWAARNIELLEGEAYFSVAHDPTRPFRIVAGRTAVEALDTELCLYLEESGARITVTHGDIHVHEYHEPAALLRTGINTEAAASAALLSVREGEEAFVTGDRTRSAPLDIRVRPVAPQEAARGLAWINDEIEFSSNGTPLSEAVFEFNRYNRVQLRVTDPGIADVKVVGRFNKNGVADFISDLRLTNGIRASTAAASPILLQRGLPDP